MQVPLPLSMSSRDQRSLQPHHIPPLLSMSFRDQILDKRTLLPHDVSSTKANRNSSHRFISTSIFDTTSRRQIPFDAILKRLLRLPCTYIFLVIKRASERLSSNFVSLLAFFQFFVVFDNSVIFVVSILPFRQGLVIRG